MTTRYSPALLAAIRAGEMIDENKYGLGVGKPRDIAPLTLTSAMRADGSQRSRSDESMLFLRRGQFARNTAFPGRRP